MRTTIVAKKASPHPTAASRTRVLSTRILLEYSGELRINSDVVRRIIAVTASQRPTSDIVNGKFILLTPEPF